MYFTVAELEGRKERMLVLQGTRIKRENTTVRFLGGQSGGEDDHQTGLGGDLEGERERERATRREAATHPCTSRPAQGVFQGAICGGDGETKREKASQSEKEC